MEAVAEGHEQLPSKQTRPATVAGRVPHDRAHALLMHSGYAGGEAFESSGQMKLKGITVLQDRGLHRLTRRSLSQVSQGCDPFHHKLSALKARGNARRKKRPGAKALVPFIPPEVLPASERNAIAKMREDKRQYVRRTHAHEKEEGFWREALGQRASESKIREAVEWEAAATEQEVENLVSTIRDLINDISLEPVRLTQILGELQTGHKHGSTRERMRRLEMWKNYLSDKLDAAEEVRPDEPESAERKCWKPGRKFSKMRTHDQELWPVSLSRELHQPKLDTERLGEVSFTTALNSGGLPSTHSAFDSGPSRVQRY